LQLDHGKPGGSFRPAFLCGGMAAPGVWGIVFPIGDGRASDKAGNSPRLLYGQVTGPFAPIDVSGVSREESALALDPLMPGRKPTCGE
jgi:hypothetical protein